MHIANSFKYGVAALSVAAAGLAPTLAAAQTSQSGDKWQVSASIYAYVPSLTGTTKFPSPGGDIDVDVLDKPQNGVHGLDRRAQRALGRFQRLPLC